MTHQIITARNITPGIFTDFFYGGLNYQIEHHLFPAAPRWSLRRIREIVKKFCEASQINYHEVGFKKSILEIYKAFYRTDSRK